MKVTTEKLKSTRMIYIDVARGIAMICIVLGHLGVGEINRVVFTFHVTLFYVVTGYFLTTKGSYREFVKKKFRTLIIPYLFSGIMVIVFAVLMNEFVLGGDNSRQIVLDWIKAILYGAGDNYTEPFVIKGIGATWFLLATFWGSCILRGILKLRERYRVVVISCVFLICFWSRSICWFPFSIQAGGCAALFMYIGYVARDVKEVWREMSSEIKIVGSLLALAIWICFMRDFQTFWLVHCDIGRGVVDVVGSLCGVYIVILMSRWLENHTNLLPRELAYLGRNSIFMLCAHIVELNTFPWWMLIERLGLTKYTFNTQMMVVFIFKMIWIIPITIIMSKWDVTRWIFGMKDLGINKKL